jgi:hypothetical protein
VPVVCADGATVALQTLMCATGERIYYQPTLTSREMNGAADAAITGAYSGDIALRAPGNGLVSGAVILTGARELLPVLPVIDAAVDP